jgi:hypothetical protein
MARGVPSRDDRVGPPSGAVREHIDERIRVLEAQLKGASWRERRGIRQSIRRLEHWRDTGELIRNSGR